MKKTLLYTTLLLAASSTAMAKEISPEEALQRAGADSPALMARGAAKGHRQLVHTSLTQGGEPAVYIFNNGNNKGYLILSADDAALPVLGYSDSGSFSDNNIPPQMKWWLSEYGRQIDYARANNIAAAAVSEKRKISRSGARRAISPQISTKWDQIEPYNGQCPLDGTNRTWTGCVATAMAQVMNYWKYPEKGTGSITYSVESIEKKVSINFALKKFDWANMLDTYINGKYTQEQADAVAYLMKACGYSVKMQYSMDASGALGMNIGNAMVKYFNYDGNLFHTLRQYYSSEQWDEMIYENLLNVGPILYGGGSTFGGGHSFVCDGYDGEGLYHFNWGWSGMSDGYFALNALNPGALGTGGGTGGGYNFDQDAVFGIQPPTGQPVETRPRFITQEGQLSGKISGTTLSFSLVDAADAMWVNYNPVNMKVKFGAMFYPQGDPEASPTYYDISDKRLSLEPGYGTSPDVLGAKINLKNLNLADGTYKVVCGSVDVSDDPSSPATDGDGFIEVKPNYGLPNYFTLTVQNGKYSVSNDLLAPLKVTGELLSELYYGTLITVRVTVENPSDVERTSGFAPVFVDANGPLLMGESISLNIPPKSTVTKEWTTSLEQFVQYIEPYLGQTLAFTFFNEVTFDFYNNVFMKEVVLKENPGTPNISLSKELGVEGGIAKPLFTTIPDANDFNVTAQLKLNSGYFSYPVVVCLCIPAAGNQIEIINTVSQNVTMTMDSEQSQIADINVNMSYPVADSSQKYYLALTYISPSGLLMLSNPLSVRFMDRSGVEEVLADNEIKMIFNRSSSTAMFSSGADISHVAVYDISGNRVDSEYEIIGNAASVRIPDKGIFIACVKDTAGNTKTFKIVK